MLHRAATLLLASFALIACASATSTPPEPSRAPISIASAPEARFEALERRLLAARSVRLRARLHAEGLVSADLRATLLLSGARMRFEVEGTLEGKAVKASLVSDGRTLHGDGAPQAIKGDTPPALAEGLMIGLTRMGLLHNAAQIAEGEAPEQTGGGVRDWVTVSAFQATAEGALSFSLGVKGGSLSEATLALDPASGLPKSRWQTVHFKSGDMRVEEIYEAFTLDDARDGELPAPGSP